MQVLLISDLDDLGYQVLRLLNESSHYVSCLNHETPPEEAVRFFQEGEPDLVIIAGHGQWVRDLCARFNAETSVPLAICSPTETVNENDIVEGYAAGADDFITWPCSSRLLDARLKALLRRVQPASSSRLVRFGDVVIDLFRHSVTVGGKAVSLTPAEFRILTCLINNAGHVVSCRSLVQESLGYDCEEETAQEIMKVHICRLRGKLEPDPGSPVHILNIRGAGYMLERRASTARSLAYSTVGAGKAEG